MPITRILIRLLRKRKKSILDRKYLDPDVGRRPVRVPNGGGGRGVEGLHQGNEEERRMMRNLFQTLNDRQPDLKPWGPQEHFFCHDIGVDKDAAAKHSCARDSTDKKLWSIIILKW